MFITQHQHLYRKSDLLNLLSKCLCDLASEWFKIQFEFISLKRFNKTLAKTFSEAFSRRVSSRSSNFQLKTLNVISKSMKNASNQQVVQMICKICKQNFNFNETLYEHIRDHETLKFVKNSHLSNNAINLVCEIKKKSSITHISFAKSQNSIFEFATTFKSIILLKRSIFSSFTFETVSKSMKNTSMQFFESITSFKNSSFTNFTFKLTCESEKKSTIACSFVSHVSSTSFATSRSQIFSTKMSSRFVSFSDSHLSSFTFETKSKSTKKTTTCSHCKQLISKQKVEWRFRMTCLSTRLKASRLNLSLNTFVTISKRMKNASIQEVACVRAMCKSCKQNFNFNKKFFEHINEHETLKRINTIKATCDFVKISTINSSSFVSLTIQLKQICESFTFSKSIISFKNSSFTNFTLKSVCESKKKSTFSCSSFSQKSNSRIVCVWAICKRCKQNFNFHNKFHEHIRQHHARKSVKSFDFRVFALESTYKVIQKSAVFCSSASFTSQFALFNLFATSRNQIFSAKMSSRFVSFKSSHFSIAKLKITSKFVKKLSVNCSLTFSFSSFRISVQKHHECHMQKLYLILNDLSRMFIEKFKSFDLRSHQNRSYFSHSLDIRQSLQSCFSIASKKFYLIIEKLFEMFDEKFKKKNMF